MQVRLVGEYTLSEFEMGLLELVDRLKENGIDEVRDVDLNLVAMDDRMIVDFVSESTGDIEPWAFLAPRQLRDARIAK